MKTIHLVTGATGMWDDYCWWNVRAFRSRKAAIKFVTKLDRIVCEHGKKIGAIDLGTSRDMLTVLLKRYDKRITHIDSTGVAYSVETLKLDTK